MRTAAWGWRLLPLVLLSLAAACGEPTPPVPGQAQIALGTVDRRTYGDNRWVDLKDSMDAELAPGAQGGFHLWLRYEIQGAWGNLLVRRIGDRIGPQGQRDRVLTTEGVVSVPTPTAEQPAWRPVDPVPSFMCPTPIGINIIDQTIELMVQVADPVTNKLLGEARGRMIARCPKPDGPMDGLPAFCQSICSG